MKQAWQQAGAGGRRWEDGERNGDLLLRAFEVLSSRAVSFGGQRGDDCIDGFCSQVERERELLSKAA